MSLQRALDALPDDPALALDELLLTWKATPGPEVGALLDALSDRFTAARPTVTDADWPRIHKRKEAADVGRLLEACVTLGTALVRFEKHPADPRLAAWCLAQAQQRFPWVPSWGGLFQILVRSGDGRMVPALEQLVRDWPEKAERPQPWIDAGSPESVFIHNQQGHEAYQGHVAALAKKLKRRDKPLPPAEAALVGPLRAAIAVARNLEEAKKPGTKMKRPALAEPGVPIEPLLERAAQATRPEERLTQLLQAWTTQRGPELAELVQRVGARITREHLPLKPEAVAVSAWRDCEAQRDPADLDRLIAAIKAGKAAEITYRLECLAKWPADPRLTRLAARLFEEQPFRSSGARHLYSATSALLVAMNDPRAPAMVARVQKDFTPGRGVDGGTDFQEFFAAKLVRAAKAVAATAAPAPLSPEAAAKIAALGKKLEEAGAAMQDDARLEQELLAMIWAAPDDDAPRLIYADFLSQRGAPHGEFIALQLSGADRRREKALQKQHAREFLGALAPAFTLSDLRFERGFVRHGALSDKVSPLIAALERHPGWVTLKSVFAYSSADTYPALMAHLRSLGVTVTRFRSDYRRTLDTGADTPR